MFRTGNLEVHIAQRVFQALDIRQDGEEVTVFYQAHSHTGHRSFNGYARIHQGQGAGANGTHGRRTVGFQYFGNQAQGVREIFFGRNHRQQCAFRQCTVTYLATARAAQGFGLPNGVRREIVMMDVALHLFRSQAFDDLCFTQRGQGAGVHDLGLTAGEERRAVYPGQQAYPAGNRTYFIQRPSVRTDLVHRDGAAYDFLNQLLGNIGNVGAVFRIFFDKRFRNFFLHAVHVFFALQFVGVHEGRFQFFSAELFDFFYQFFRRIVFGHFHFRFADFSLDAADKFADLFNVLMSKENRVQHFLLGDFLAAGFYHQDSVRGSGYRQVQAAHLELFHSRVDDVLPVNQAYAHAGDRSFKRNIGYAQSSGSTDHARDIRRIVRIYGNRSGNDLHIIPVPVREHGTDRTVNQTAGQYRMGAGTAFPFDKASGDFAYRVHFFFEINSQREEIHAFTRGLGTGSGNHHNRVAITHQQTAVGLFADFAEFQRQRSAAQVHCVTLHHFSSYTLTLSLTFAIKLTANYKNGLLKTSINIYIIKFVTVLVNYKMKKISGKDFAKPYTVFCS